MRISDCISDVCSSDLYLSAETASSAVYRDNIGTMARDLGKDFDARSSVEYETALRARLTAWIRVRRSEIPGVALELEIGRTSGRERVCQYVYISVVAVSLHE